MAIFTVESKHISYGTQMSSKYCPIALALQEAFATDNVFVGAREVTIYFNNDRNYKGKFILPYEVTRFIRRFDNNLLVNPFEFELNLEVNLEVEVR